MNILRQGVNGHCLGRHARGGARSAGARRYGAGHYMQLLPRTSVSDSPRPQAGARGIGSLFQAHGRQTRTPRSAKAGPHDPHCHPQELWTCGDIRRPAGRGTRGPGAALLETGTTGSRRPVRGDSSRPPAPAPAWSDSPGPGDLGRPCEDRPHQGRTPSRHLTAGIHARN